MADRQMSWVMLASVGLMLFALFFGAGNLIFPALLGQQAGMNWVAATVGFLLTGAGLPLLGVVAIGLSGERDVRALASRAHPVFGLLFAFALYLTIGPFFALPRTATVSYEVGVAPLLQEAHLRWALALFTLAFFAVSLWLALSPNRLVDRVGKILTPLLLLCILVLVAFAWVSPMGALQQGIEKYSQHALMAGFVEGYNTMDALASLVFGVMVLEAIRQKTQHHAALRLTAYAGMIAVGVLALVYTAIAYLGASSVAGIGLLDNGAKVLALSAQHYLGTVGNILLAVIVLLACLTTSVGLITACASFFQSLMPQVSYKLWAVGLSVFSAVVANWGLSALISFAIPVLMVLYPLTVVVILLTLLSPITGNGRAVYGVTILFTLPFALLDGYNAAVGLPASWMAWFGANWPLYTLNLGWLLPAVVGLVLGYLLSDKKRVH